MTAEKDIQEEILLAIQEVKTEARLLVVKLYGENGFEGDITEIKNKLQKVDKNEIRSKVNQIIISLILVSCGLSAGITKLMAIW